MYLTKVPVDLGLERVMVLDLGKNECRKRVLVKCFCFFIEILKKMKKFANKVVLKYTNWLNLLFIKTCYL